MFLAHTSCVQDVCIKDVQPNNALATAAHWCTVPRRRQALLTALASDALPALMLHVQVRSSDRLTCNNAMQQAVQEMDHALTGVLTNATHAAIVLQAWMRQCCIDPPLTASWLHQAPTMKFVFAGAVDALTTKPHGASVLLFSSSWLTYPPIAYVRHLILAPGHRRLAACVEELLGYASAAVAAARGPAQLLATLSTALCSSEAGRVTSTHHTATATASLVLLAARLGSNVAHATPMSDIAAMLTATDESDAPVDVVQLVHRALQNATSVLADMDAQARRAVLDAAPRSMESSPALGATLVCAAAAALDAVVHVVRSGGNG